MSDEAPVVEVARDEQLEKRLLRAIIADRNEVPRNAQTQAGPSALGHCRELLRATVFDGGMNALQETHWATAAHVGTVMGDELERIFSQRLQNVITQQRVTTKFPRLGVSISGAIDLLMIDEDCVADLKSKSELGGVMYDLNRNVPIIDSLLTIARNGTLYREMVETPNGDYELTEAVLERFAFLSYYVQVATYVVGARQAGVLGERSTGRLIFYDRSGDSQEVIVVVISADEIDLFFEIGQVRLEQIVAAQDAYDATGNPAVKAHLRDKTPSFCFSPKVMCPMRDACWGGSDWEPREILTDVEHSQAADRYIEGRRLAKLGDGMKRAAKEELRGISGAFADGRAISWVRGGSTINVTETGAVTGPKPQTPAEGVTDAGPRPTAPAPLAGPRTQVERELAAADRGIARDERLAQMQRGADPRMPQATDHTARSR